MQKGKCTFSKTAIEERIKPIMNMKKISLATLFLTFLLVGSVTTVFATSSKRIDVATPAVPLESQKHITRDTEKITQNSVVYESVEVLQYDGYPELGIEGTPYIHDIKTSHTEKKIVSSQRGMLAFDQYGDPLKIEWYGVNPNYEASYFFLYDWDESEINPGGTDDIVGGWSLDVYGSEEKVKKIAYVLYCDKEITFEDGTVWKNPSFQQWRSTYEGEIIEVNILDNYYPYVQKISN